MFFCVVASHCREMGVALCEGGFFSPSVTAEYSIRCYLRVGNKGAFLGFEGGSYHSVLNSEIHFNIAFEGSRQQPVRDLGLFSPLR